MTESDCLQRPGGERRSVAEHPVQQNHQQHRVLQGTRSELETGLENPTQNVSAKEISTRTLLSSVEKHYFVCSRV